MRISDYIVKHLQTLGISQVFMVTGGGAMFLNDAFGHGGLNYICCHHEQACAIAAEGYARVTGKMAVVNVTTGPGGINALNGVFGAWTDSIPMLIVSGQVKQETLMAHYNLPNLRQLGDQEADIIRMVEGITKYAVLVTDPHTIRYHLEKAVYLASTGRPGPCWLDIPIDIQSAQIDEAALTPYDSAEDALNWDMDFLQKQCQEVLQRIQNADRPAIMVGTGIHLSQAQAVFDRVIQKLGIPVTTAWTAHDLIASDDPHYCGRPGTIGNRPGNFTIQNADVVLVIGSRLNIRQVGYNWKTFGRGAFLIQVDIDAEELQKPTVQPHLPVHSDAKLFLETLEKCIDSCQYTPHHQTWLAWCKDRVNRYPGVLPKHRQAENYVNPYYFMEVLFDTLKPDDVVVCGDGSACVITYQAASIKKGLRMFCNSGCASMGYDLPAAIGAAVARGGKRVICLAGDGSLQMNIQELQTVIHHQFPIKLFVLNNGGYLSIKQTQLGFFKRCVGEGPDSGVSFPDMVKVGQAYGFTTHRLDTHQSLQTRLTEILETPGPMLCEVILSRDQSFEPKASSKQLADGRIVSTPLEDMYPFLEKEELLSNMLIPVVE